MNCLRSFSLIFIFLFVINSAAVGAGQSVVLTDDVQMALGRAFMAEQDYYRAITEYKKLHILFPDSAYLAEAHYQIGMAYYLGKDYAAAIKSFVKVRQNYDAAFYSSAAFHEGLCYTRLGRLGEAELAFERSRFFDAKHPAAVDAQLALALNALEKNDPAGCRSDLENFLLEYPEDDRAAAVQSSLGLLGQYEAHPKKSPVAAGILSAVLPGAGQVYAEHYRDGAMAFVVNGLFIAGTIIAIDDENYPAAAIVGGIGLPFYVGNIYGAANSARKWNLSLGRELHDELVLRWNYKF